MARSKSKKQKRKKKLFLLSVVLSLLVVGCVFAFVTNFTVYKNNSLRYIVILPKTWAATYWGRPISESPEYEETVRINPVDYKLYDWSKIEINDFEDRTFKTKEGELIEEINIGGQTFQRFTDYDQTTSTYVVWLLGNNKENKRILIIYRYQIEEEEREITKILNALHFY